MAIKTSVKPPWQVKVRSKSTAYFQVANKPKIEVEVKKQCGSNLNPTFELPTLNELMIVYTMGKL